MRSSLSALLLDEVMDYVRAYSPGSPQCPLWQVTTGATHRGRLLHVTVEIDGAVVAEADARDLGTAQQKALEQFRQWESDQPQTLASALTASIEEATRRKAAR